ncbi:CLUMA_CG019448, isoform A [Clunio marinus]|uniref:CLUMA_CG019448, isoform A n=1 Tax=Clunio marinus TaxID=568069 RepID=A0A1J1J4A5_9DIPT|nr:CLUMA_CG019448, isoform A [Clunio marinus]
MSTKSPGPQRCRLILKQCLAIQLSKAGNAPEDFWMYDSGYMIFQNFLAANSQCWWNTPLTAATRALKYAGHVAPGMLLVTAEPCALEILRGAYARSVLKPPATYTINAVGDIDDCIVTTIQQTQFTPLTEAICDVIMDLTQRGQSATLETIKKFLSLRFAHMQQPSNDIIYDTLVQLQQERKIYQTSKGYFIVTPERRRSRSRAARNQMSLDEELVLNDRIKSPHESRTMLMTNSEAIHSLYGEISTERDGDLTHQCIQTNLADVICGGNPNDKILYPRSAKRRSASFPTPRSLERRHSLRLFGSSKRLQRCQSTKSLTKTTSNNPPNVVMESSNSEYNSTDSSSPKKSASLLSRIFRRSCRSSKKLETFSAQFPPREWFNSKAVHLQSVGTQTLDHNDSLSNAISYYDGSEISQRSMTLPRQHHRRNLSSESTFLLSSRDCSPIRRRSPAICYGGSLPRSTHSIPGRSPKRTPLSKQVIDENNRTLAKSGEIYNKSSLSGQHETQLSQRFPSSRNNYSGPSSLESGKTSSLVTSGPSSIDSGNKSLSLSRNSGHSSLDSAHGSVTTVAQGQSSPKSAAKHKLIKSSGTSTSKVTTSTSSSGMKSTSFEDSAMNSRTLPNSNSNGSITLQVTNNSNGTCLPNTKIFVQNSPVRTSITFENGKFIENSNVFVINNETTTNSKGEVVASRKTLMNNPSSPLKQPSQRRPEKPRTFGNGKENCFSENDEAASETGDSLSMISETSPDSSLIPYVDDDVVEPGSRRENKVQSPESPRNTKNFDDSLNNRKLSLQIGSPEKSGGNNTVVYNNMLKNHYNQQTNAIISPVIQHNNNKMNMFSYENSGSVGNLKVEKSSCNYLNSNPTINSDSLLNIFHKNIIAVGSEPNLITMNKPNDNGMQKINNCIKDSPTSPEEKTPTMETKQELYSFPSLTDLSFNFTSLHAQKILKGGMSVNNSIDTLVELDINKPSNHKSNSNLSPSTTICTDFGMV